MSDEVAELDGYDAAKITESLPEGVQIYKHGDSVAITSRAIQRGEADALHLTYDELVNLLVDIRPHFQGGKNE